MNTFYKQLAEDEKKYPLTREKLKKHMVEFNEPVIINNGESMQAVVNGEIKTLHAIPGYEYVRKDDAIVLTALKEEGV